MNDDSLVMRMQYGKASVLLEGDAEAPSEAAMLAMGAWSRDAAEGWAPREQDFDYAGVFCAAAPSDAVVSVGRGNTFGHPRYEVIDRIAEAHTRLYRTDEFGLTTFLLGREGGIREIVGASNQ